jgi:hypothetical protein
MSATQHKPIAQRLRVADSVLRSFEYACVMHDLKTAAMLLAILEDLHTRGVRRFGGERRRPGNEIDTARERLTRMCGDQSPPPRGFAESATSVVTNIRDGVKPFVRSES